jgi:iron complex outermembrane receptor protein
MKKFSLTITLLFYSLLANAQEKSDSIRQINLDERVIVQGVRATAETPATFTTVQAKKFRSLNFGQEPSFLLNRLPSITNHADAGSFSGYSYFRIRGIDQTRVNMTLDGVPLNETEDQGAYFNNIPDLFSSINSLQIQRGVGTTANGTASYAGSINLESPVLDALPSLHLEGNAGSFNSWRSSLAWHSGKQGKFAFYGRGSLLGSDGFKNHSAHQARSLFLSGGYFGTSHLLKMNVISGFQQNEMAWLGASKEQIRDNPRYNPHVNEDDQFNQNIVTLNHSWAIDNHSFLSTTVFYNHLRGNYDFDLNVFLGLPSDGNLFNYALEHHFTGLISNYTWGNQWLDINAGLHVNTFEREHVGSETTAGKLYENTGQKREASTYLKANLKVGKWQIYSDLQLRYANFNYFGDVAFDQLQWTFFNPKAGIQYAFKRGHALYYSIGKTNREPTRNDIFMGEDNLSADENGLPVFTAIAPESVLDQELGYKWHRENLDVQLNAFYMNFSNEIVLNGAIGPTGLPLRENVDNSYRAGMELFTHWKLGRWAWQNSTSWMQSGIRQNNLTITPVLTPDFISNQIVSYVWQQLTLTAEYRHQSAMYIDFANQHVIDGFHVLDFAVDYQLGKITLNARLNNLTNDWYFTNGYLNFEGNPRWHVQAPFNFQTGLRWQIF